jgi:hypothetical protein
LDPASAEAVPARRARFGNLMKSSFDANDDNLCIRYAYFRLFLKLTRQLNSSFPAKGIGEFK